MELDFDKEIDALLRKARGTAGMNAGDATHLEADEIAAFAENALPEKTRMFFTAHLADCDRCRKILTNTIHFNAEAAPAASAISAPVIAASTEPWYRRLFLFPNLAYVMGGLVLVFSAFLGYTVLRNTNGDLASSVTQVAEKETAPGGPRLGDEQIFSTDSSANSASNAASAAANTSVNTMTASANKTANPASALANSNTASRPSDERVDILAKNAPTGTDKEVMLDSVSAGVTAEAPAPPPAPKSVKDDGAREKMKREAASEEDRKNVMDSSTMNSRQVDQQSVLGRGGPSKKPSGPSRDMNAQFPNRTQNSYEVAVTRTVSGKKFERKEAVWYDSAYSGQPTTNVRRGTDAYRKLDAVVRSVAESLGGTVVIVSGGKAYRIQ